MGTSQTFHRGKHVNNIPITQARKAESRESFSLDEMSGDYRYVGKWLLGREGT